MATYSTGSPPTDATRLEDLQSVLNVLPDNTSKLISPKDVRDSIFTTWEEIKFKTTSATGTGDYIGIDRNDEQYKMLFGKKSVNGYPIMTSLSGTEADIVLYNNKTEPTSDHDTTIVIHAGTSSGTDSGNITTPHIKAVVVTNPGQSKTVDLQIKNTSRYLVGGTGYGGNIAITSENGNVTVNGLWFPTLAENTVGPSLDGKVLKYQWSGGVARLVWASAGTAAAESLYGTGTVSITGNPVLINGQPTTFTSLDPAPQTIGGISAGTTFSNVPFHTMFMRLLYPYIKPSNTFVATAPIIQAGWPSIGVSELIGTVSISSTYSVSAFNLFLPPGGGYAGTLPATASFGLGDTGFSINPIVGFPEWYLSDGPTHSWARSGYTFSVTDYNGGIATASATITTVLPLYWGTSNVGATQALGASGINSILGTSSPDGGTTLPVTNKLTPKLVSPILSATSSHNIDLEFSGNLKHAYIGYPANYSDITSIIDQNGYDVTSAFRKFTVGSVSSPDGWWSQKDYKFYIYVGPTAGATTPMTTSFGNLPNWTATYQIKFD